MFRFEREGNGNSKKVAVGMGVIVAKEWDGQIGCMLGRHDAIILAEYGCNSHFFLYFALHGCCYTLVSQLEKLCDGLGSFTLSVISTRHLLISISIGKSHLRM